MSIVQGTEVEMEELCVEVDEEALMKEFDRLDAADGKADGQINKDSLIKWLRSLELRNKLDEKSTLNLTSSELKRLFTEADKNKDGFVDREEFVDLVRCQNKRLTTGQQSILRHYLNVIAYAEDYTCCPPPLFIIFTSIVQVIVFLCHQLLNFDPSCSVLIYSPVRRTQAWRYISYSLVHGSLTHVIFNSGFELLVGLPLEMTNGSWRTALVYFSGVLAGSLGSSSFEPGFSLAGASGGVYALISAHLASLILNWDEDTLILRRRIRATTKFPKAKHGKIVRLIRLLFVLIFACLETGIAINNSIKHRETSTSLVAHACGALSGLLVGIAVLKNRRVEHWEIQLQRVCIGAIVMLNFSAISWNIIANDLILGTLQLNSTYFRPEEIGLYSEHCRNTSTHLM